MNDCFRTDADIPLPAFVHARGCRCALHSRRLFTGGLLAAAALPALAREGVDVGPRSSFTKLVSAEQVEKAAVGNYQQLRQEAASKNALAPDNHPQVIRLRAIAKRIKRATVAGLARAIDKDIDRAGEAVIAGPAQGRPGRGPALTGRLHWCAPSPSSWRATRSRSTRSCPAGSRPR